MTDTVGFNNLKTIIDLGCELIKVGKTAYSNGKNVVADVTLVVGELPTLAVEIPAAIAAFPNVKPEIEALDAPTAAQVIAYVAAKYSCADAKAIAIANAAITVVFDGIALYKAIES